MRKNALAIWTVGHSTHSIEEFIDLLRHHQIETLVDVRRFPGSRKFPHFNQGALNEALVTAGIRYEHLVELGGRRPVQPESHNVAWRNASFRGYADYMETGPFRGGVERLLAIARVGRLAIMCSEAVWWRCHRSMIADYLKAIDVQVFHILSAKKVQEHPYTSAARLVDGSLWYGGITGDEPGPGLSAPILRPQPLQESNPMPREFKVGDHVEWNSEAGRVRGSIKKKISSEITFKGYKVHASKEEPQYLIKSDTTEHMAMHKGSALKKLAKARS